MQDKLSKKDKAELRHLIEKGVQAEFTKALEETAATIQQWKQGTSSNREAYHALYTGIQQHNDFISRRYVGITGSRYVPTVAAIYRDKQLTEEDLMALSDEVKEYIKKVTAVE
jgi:hypothetical protein